MESEFILEVKKLSTSVVTNKKEIEIIKDVSFNLRKGKVLALVGESGCGKSMTVNSIMKMLPRNAKTKAESILLREIDATGEVTAEHHIERMENASQEIRKIRGSRISMIFQDPMASLNPVYRVGDQIVEGLLEHNKKLNKKEAIAMAINMLKTLEIPSPEQRINDYPHQFSGGMKQRIVIAIALINNPDIIFADEPTTALDVTIQAQILELLKHLQVEAHKTIILITHNLGIVADMADDIAIMYMGRIVEKGTREDIFLNPSHPYTKALLKSVPVLGNHHDRLLTIPGSTPDPSSLNLGCEFATRCEKSGTNCCCSTIPLYKLSDSHVVRCLLFADKEKEYE